MLNDKELFMNGLHGVYWKIISFSLKTKIVSQVKSSAPCYTEKLHR